MTSMVHKTRGLREHPRSSRKQITPLRVRNNYKEIMSKLAEYETVLTTLLSLIFAYKYHIFVPLSRSVSSYVSVYANLCFAKCAFRFINLFGVTDLNNNCGRIIFLNGTLFQFQVIKSLFTFFYNMVLKLQNRLGTDYNYIFSRIIDYNWKV